MAQGTLVDLISEDRLEDLEKSWSEALGEPGNIDHYVKALQLLCERDMASRALALASPMVEALDDASRTDDAFRLGMTLVQLDAHNDNLAKRLFALLEKRFSTEAWYSVVLELSGLTEASVSRKSLDAFEKMRRYTKGHVVYHRAGWGEGLVEDMDPEQRELTIRFASGRTQEIPLSAAVDSMTPLDEDDLRAMILTSAEELQRLVKEEPSLLIRKVAKIYRGNATSSEVKATLAPAVVPTKKWASFWKRAKAAAALDPYLQVEGSTTRPTFVLRKKPLSMVEEAQGSLRHCDNLGEEVALLREYLDRSNDADAQAEILTLASDRIEAGARDARASHAHILDGILLLEKHDRHPSTSAASELRAMLYGEGDEFDPDNFDLLATQDARQHAVGLLPEALGETWADQCVAKLTLFPVSVVEQVVGLLTEKGHAAQLISLWNQVAPYPRRHPAMTYLLGRAYADGAFDGLPGAPDPIAVARVLLHLARVLSSLRRDAWLGRLQTRVASLLAGRRMFMTGVLEDIDRDNLATFLGICERGGSQFPQEITALVLRAVSEKYPDLTATPETPFWEDDNIYVTRAGLALRREEYRKLVDELIPANSRQIGAAASQGDLSENSEWEAAIEEQRNLTSKATMLDEELNVTKLLEDQNIPDGVVAPGTAVTYVDAQSGEQQTLRILGPWDATSDDVINYRAPRAQSLLGKAPGDTASLPGEHGEVEVRIESIERIV